MLSFSSFFSVMSISTTKPDEASVILNITYSKIRYCKVPYLLVFMDEIMMYCIDLDLSYLIFE